jgi:uncharacterized protein (DUF1697 family)
MTTYVAFLRGIGGTATKIKMQVLKEAFEGLGFQNVRTVIASGNVIFEAEPAPAEKLERTIEEALPGTVGFGADTVVYTWEDLQGLAKSSLVKEMKATPRSRPFVTFLKEPPKGKATFNGKGYKVLGKKGRAVLSVADGSGGETAELLRLLEREFGKRTTTRSWMTIEKILQK